MSETASRASHGPVAQEAVREEMELLSALLRDRELAFGRPAELPRCGRPSRSGKPCRAVRMRLPESGPTAEDAGYMPPACAWHATDTEKREHDRICADSEALAAVFEQRLQDARRVHCLGWPVTAAHQERARGIAAIADPDDAYLAAARLLWDWQQGICAICGARAEILDHDHETALIRGWLCRPCNVSEAFSAASVHHRYRKRHPAVMLGIKVAYGDPWQGWAQPQSPPGREMSAEACSAVEGMMKSLGF